jgi:hypothetical protein
MDQPRPSLADEYETSDLGIAAFLAAKDFPVLRVEVGQRSAFVFPAGAEQTAKLFYLPGSNLVDARRFHTMLRELRGLAKGGRP